MGKGLANSSYEYSKVLWEYKNIFERPESLINYPTEVHWMLDRKSRLPEIFYL